MHRARSTREACANGVPLVAVARELQPRPTHARRASAHRMYLRVNQMAEGVHQEEKSMQCRQGRMHLQCTWARNRVT